MFLRILSFFGPLWVYATMAILLYGIVHERKRFEWPALVLGVGGLLASALFLSSGHRLFFDEDIYINAAVNLARAPVNQVTVVGSSDQIQVSTYNKEPAGWPVLLSFVFLVAGRSETVAFWSARLLFALAVAAVYQLARASLLTRPQASLAATLFAATPVCFVYSVSAGTDIAAALMGILGMWGLLSGNGALAAAGLAFAAQTRMELLVLVPLVWLSPKISLKWKVGAVALALFEIVHVSWVMSVAPALERVEEVSSTFAIRYIGRNLLDNLRYFLNPFGFPAMVSVFAGIFLWRRVSPLLRSSDGEPSPEASPYRARAPRARRPLPGGEALIVWPLGLFAVYLCFYAGSFDMNPRYSIQMLAPMTILAAALAKRLVWIGALLLSVIVPANQRYETTPYFKALEIDHRLSVEFASRLKPDDSVVSGQHEIFINYGRRAINAPFASTRKAVLEDEIQKHRKLWYHAGVRANVPNTEEWRADRWMKSNFELHLIDAHEVSGYTISFYEILANRIDREAR